MKEGNILETHPELLSAIAQIKIILLESVGVWNTVDQYYIERKAYYFITDVLEGHRMRIKPEPVTDEIWCKWAECNGVMKVVAATAYGALTGTDSEGWGKYIVTLSKGKT